MTRVPTKFVAGARGSQIAEGVVAFDLPGVKREGPAAEPIIALCRSESLLPTTT